MTGILGVVVTASIYAFVKHLYKDTLRNEVKRFNKESEENKPPVVRKSRFQQRLDEAMEKRNKK